MNRRCGLPASWYPNPPLGPVPRCGKHVPHALSLNRWSRVVIGPPLKPLGPSPDGCNGIVVDAPARRGGDGR